MSDTNIRVNVKTRDRLASIGKYGDSMDDIINRCIDAYYLASGEDPHKPDV